MAFVHGKGTVVKLNSVDLSAFTDNTAFSAAADEHDVTTYGATGHVAAGGLTNGSVTLTGTYDDGVTGPGPTISALMGTVTAFEYLPKGTGTGKPKRSCQVLVAGYDETAPVADMIKWTAKLTISGAVSYANQA